MLRYICVLLSMIVACLKICGQIGVNTENPRGLFEVANQFVINNVTGDVGVGTVAPAVKLDLVGTLRFDNNGANVASQVLESDLLGNASWRDYLSPVDFRSATLRPDRGALNTGGWHEMSATDLVLDEGLWLVYARIAFLGLVYKVDETSFPMEIGFARGNGGNLYMNSWHLSNFVERATVDGVSYYRSNLMVYSLLRITSDATPIRLVARNQCGCAFIYTDSAPAANLGPMFFQAVRVGEL